MSPRRLAAHAEADVRPGAWARLRGLVLPGLLALLTGCSGGGGGGAGGVAVPTAPVVGFGAGQLAVLIAEGDPTSEAIALAYQRARGIPDAHMIRVSLPRPAADTLSAADFATLKASIDARLPAQVQATLLTWTQPSRVVGTCTMGITSALALGYDARYCGGCVATAASPYFNVDTRRPFTDLGVRPSMMLGAATLAEAQQLIARGVAADASWLPFPPTGAQAFAMRTTDAARSTRAGDFQLLASSAVPGLSVRFVDNANGAGSDEVSGQTAVMFYFTGLARVNQAASNRYLPGAVADTLTSFAGLLPDGLGQMPATDWLKAGLTASYGTVEEPCNYTEKFPRATVMVGRYARGETLLAAYWKSEQWPGQGLFVGEPLARPWAAN